MRARRRRFRDQVREHGLLAGIAGWSSGLLTRPANSTELAPPSALAVQSVSFPSRSGSTIRAWLLTGSPGGGAVVLLHGVRGNRSSMVARARFLHRAGYTVLLPDFQAHGESAGSRITFGALESWDAEASLEFVRGCSGVERVGMIGVSMGGAAAVLGSGPLRADAYVLESVYPSIRQALEDRLGVWLGPLGVLNRLLAAQLIRGVHAEIGIDEDALRPIDRIGSLGAPVFMIAGTHDAYTPLRESRALFEHACEPKDFWAVEGARHQDMHAYAGELYEQRVGEFLARHLRATTT